MILKPDKGPGKGAPLLKRVKLKTGALSHSEFRWFYAGRSVSLFGSAMTPVALAFAVLQLQQGAHLLGYILAAEILPNVMVVLLGGIVSDRYRRDKVLLLCSLGSGVMQAGIASIVLLGESPYWIFPFAIVNGILGAFTSPAMKGIIPDIVPNQDDIAEANSLLSTARSAARIVGPTVAGILSATVGGGWGIAIDAASFLVAAVCLTRVKIPARVVASHASLLREMHEGWSYFRRQRWLWSITAAFTVMNTVQMGVWQVLGPTIAKSTFGSTGWGLALSVKSVGLLTTSLVMLRMQLHRPLRDSMIAIAVCGVPLIVLGQGYGLPYLVTVAAFAGAGQTVSAIAWDTSLQQAIPRDKLSRVCAFDDFGSYVAIPLGEILAVPMANTFGYQTVATLGGIVFIAVALFPLLEPLVRNMTTEAMKSLHTQ